jgi:F-type H+-transporting ATPase subunit b
MDFRASPLYKPVFDFGILNLDLNTPLFILVLVLIVMFCLNKLLFQPVLATLERREGVLRQLAEQAGKNKAEVERLTKAYEADLARAREEVATVRALAHAEAQRATETILQQARKASESTLDRAMTDLRHDIVRAKTELAKSAQQLATATANRVLNG